MQDSAKSPLLNRRRALVWGGSLLAGTVVGSQTLRADDRDGDGDKNSQPSAADKQLASQIEQTLGAQGMFSNGVFQVEIDRNDINDVTLNGVSILPPFQINGTIYFQFLGSNQAIMNADMALKPEEIDPFIDQLLTNNIAFQAEHQHFYDFVPMVWFIHFRQTADALQIASGIKAALNVTSTPFPQTLPSNPTTPLPADKLGAILGASPQVGDKGVVNFNVPRKNPIVVAGVRINPYLNVATLISFEPLDSNGSSAAAVVDFGMVAREIAPVMRVMRPQGWDIGCLYNQETDEQPQLYFSHQFKTGDPVTLATQIRNGLNRMNMKFQ